jgi:hypothetical protein
MGKYLRISSYIRKPFLILYMTLQLIHSEFPYIWGTFDFLFYQCIDCAKIPGKKDVWWDLNCPRLGRGWIQTSSWISSLSCTQNFLGFFQKLPAKRFLIPRSSMYKFLHCYILYFTYVRTYFALKNHREGGGGFAHGFYGFVARWINRQRSRVGWSIFDVYTS